MSFFKGYTIVMGANIVMLVLSVLNNKLMYVFMEPEANGVFFLILRLSTLGAFLFGDWLRLSNLNISGSTPALIQPLLANTVWYCITLGMLSFIGFRFLSPLLPGSVFGVGSVYIPVVIAGAIGLILKDELQAILVGSQRLVHFALTYILFSSVYFGLNILFLVLLGFGLRAVIAAWLTSVAAGAIWAFTALVKFTTRFSLRPAMEVLRESRTIGSRALVAMGGMFIMINAHTFAIEPILGSTGATLVMVAMFSVCFRIFQLFQRFSDIASTLIHSRSAREETDGNIRVTVLTARSGVLFSLCVSLVTVCFGKFMILFIADARYTEAYFPLLAMLPGVTAVSAGSILNGYYWGRGYPWKITLAPFAATVFGLVLNWVLMPRIGLTGATLSFSLMNLVWVVYLATVFSHDTGIKFHHVLVPQISDIRLILTRIRRIPVEATG